MKYRHLIWDFDGTLFDTYPRICRAYQKALADAGIVEEEGVLFRSVKKSLEYTNAWVGAKYGLTDDEIAFIESMIKPMDLGGADA